jgi:glycosyltransferase involved in cell wall biosynthesis
VRFVGAVSRAEMIALYARCAAVFFGPLDEDYGYVTLEAMLSGKPVITCTDSGGPLEFVLHGETGWIAEPHPEAVAVALEKVMADPVAAAEMGRAGRERIEAMEIGWDHVVAQLIEAAMQQAPQPVAA